MEKAKEAAKGLNNANGFIKHEVNSRIKMRRIPDFHFIADDSTEYSAGIAKILNSLDIRHDDEEGTEEE
ncbi:ribosome-binding factor A [Clostridium sp. CAG:169]|nr:ribosome-binding factor A [Clostridium sp. CAG:169]